MLVCTCSWQIYVIISRVVRLSRAPLSLACASPVAEAELELRPGPLMREAGKDRPRRGGAAAAAPPPSLPVAVPLAAVASLRAAASAAEAEVELEPGPLTREEGAGGRDARRHA